MKEDQWFTKDGNRCLGVAEEEKERCPRSTEQVGFCPALVLVVFCSFF